MLHDLTPGQGFAIPVLANFEDEKVFVPYEMLESAAYFTKL